MMRSLERIASMGLVVALLVAPAFLATQVVRGAGAVTMGTVDTGWPREITTGKGTITLYQPQPETFTGNLLTGRAAMSFSRTGETEPVFGAFWFEARVETDRDGRTVAVRSLKISRVRFPQAAPDQEKSLTQTVEEEVPKWDLTFSLDGLLTSLHAAAVERKAAEGLRNEPPKIIFTDHPALLLVLQGDPVLRDIENTRLRRVVNTPYPIIFDPASKAYYLTSGESWFSAADVMGPWQAIAQPPEEVSKAIPKDAIQEGLKAAQTPGSVARSKDSRPPEIIVTKEPAELIYSEGKPNFASLEGTDLLYMTNTDGDVFVDTKTQEHYVLLAGRWYRGKTLDGPWAFVRPDQLPGSFTMISPASPKAIVRAHVAGTDEAEDSLMDAQIPQTTAIKRSEAKLTVTYDGPPRFEKIGGTDIEYAVNTPQEVLRIHGAYYCCDQGVWFVSNGPNGPWVVSDRRPDEVDSIPPSCPDYNVKYVYVYDSNPDVVYVGYLPGYVGCYPYYGTVVWGTGWYYSPWIGTSCFFPRPLTWGCFARFDPWCGWCFGHPFWGGFLGVGLCWHGGLAFHFGLGFGWGGGFCGWFGPAGFRPFSHFAHFGDRDIRVANFNIHNRTGTFQNNIFQMPGNRMRNASFAEVSMARSRQQTRILTGQPNNVFADKQGNVFRRTDRGWEQRGQTGWSRTEQPAIQNRQFQIRHETETPRLPSVERFDRTPPAESPGGLEREFRARERGAQRSQGFYGGMRGGFQPPRSFRSMGPMPGGGFRGGMSGFRGGMGGFRGGMGGGMGGGRR